MAGQPNDMNYASAGVDIDLEGSAVSSLVGALSKSVRKTGTPGAPVDLPGGFGGIIEFGDSLLALATDGVGSKLQIASKLNQWYGVGIDCMAMNVNDLLCVGAEPIAFVDYIATPKPDPETHKALGESLAKACELARVTLAGGETASLPGIVTELDLSGTALGYMPKGEAITGENLQAGDILIGLPSSGIHSNGYSLVRKVIDYTEMGYDEECPFNPHSETREIMRFNQGTITLGEVILNPTKIYVDPVIDMLNAGRDGNSGFDYSDIHAIGHITGGGLSNLLRLHDSLGWHIETPLPIHPEFSWMAGIANIDDLEMHRTFNMGMGMVIAVSAQKADAIADWLAEKLPGSSIVGYVHDNGHQVTHVNPNIKFTHY